MQKVKKYAESEKNMQKAACDIGQSGMCGKTKGNHTKKSGVYL
jgi:hypothetical protein